MKKDVVLAVFIGFLIGIISALFTIRLSNLIRQKKQTQPIPVSQTAKEEPSPIINLSSLNLTIESPANNSFSDTKSISIKGKTGNDNLLVIENDEEAKIFSADSEGNFSETVNLEEGGNRLIISTYNKKGDRDTKTLDIYFTENKL